MKKLLIITLTLIMSILPVFAFAGCSVGEQAKFEVTVNGDNRVSQTITREQFLDACRFTFVPAENEKYFIVRSEEVAKRYGVEGTDWERAKDTSYTFHVFYKTFNNNTYDEVTSKGVSIVMIGFEENPSISINDKTRQVEFTMYNKKYTLKYTVVH